MNLDEKIKERIYLPAQRSGVNSLEEYLKRYIAQEFAEKQNGATNSIYSIPKVFNKQQGEKQAGLAERGVFDRLKGLRLGGVWVVFFYSAAYGGRSYRNHRAGKLVIREHDFVVFVKYSGKYYLALVEVKSTKDNLTGLPLEKTSDPKVIKNNKRSAQHQLRDHIEVLENIFGEDVQNVQKYVMWPFLTATTKDNHQNSMRRWKEERNLHVFEDTLSNQASFDAWFKHNILQGHDLDKDTFARIFSRFIILGCGVVVDEIDRGLVALLTQEQLFLLNNNICQNSKALVVHGAAGTGKTLLVLQKLKQLHENGLLNAENRALYICYWPGIRCDVEFKLDFLGLRPYVDTIRFYISIKGFLVASKKTYKHIFMDEAEALCLALDGAITRNTFSAIYERYHDGNCVGACPHSALSANENIHDKLKSHAYSSTWGELWFMVDINQASMFIPKHSPPILKTPSIILTKVMRPTGHIFNLFKQFYSEPMPLFSQNSIKIPEIALGHHVSGPPIYWADAKQHIDEEVAKVVIDLCTTKGFKPNELCVIPFLVNEKLVPERINHAINGAFVEGSFRPKGVRDVEEFLKGGEVNGFLMAWALRVKGLEFKVVIMAVDDDDFDGEDGEDRKKLYIMASRCTSMLILISKDTVRNAIDMGGTFETYPFSHKL